VLDENVRETARRAGDDKDPLGDDRRTEGVIFGVAYIPSSVLTMLFPILRLALPFFVAASAILFEAGRIAGENEQEASSSIASSARRWLSRSSNILCSLMSLVSTLEGSPRSVLSSLCFIKLSAFLLI
jgi:hypothetical protein